MNGSEKFEESPAATGSDMSLREQVEELTGIIEAIMEPLASVMPAKSIKAISARIENVKEAVNGKAIG